jgi:MFS transporter, ACS family, glucarate transporter
MAHASLHPDLPPSATRVRYVVLGFGCTLSMITYLDRVCMASAAKPFVEELGLKSVADLNWVFAAFSLAYALFEVPSGWLGDVFGPRSVLIRIILWWSAFTALTGLIGLSVGGGVIGSFGVGPLVVTPLVMLIAVRFLFGIGEAGAYPNITRALHNWFPVGERGFAQGAVWMCGRMMGGLTPLVWMGLMAGLQWFGQLQGQPSEVSASSAILRSLASWRGAFWVFAAVGVVWCVAFALWFRNRPEEKPGVNAAELELIRAGGIESQAAHKAVPWSRIFASRNLWVLCLMYGCQSYGWAFYITYLPSFLEDQYHVEAVSTLGAIYKGGPLWMGAIGCLVGGLLTDRLVRRTGNRRLGRSLLGVIGHTMTVACFLVCPYMPNAFWFFLAISLAGFFTDLTMGSAWALCQDIGRRHAAMVAGFMNMAGSVGNVLANWLTGFILQQSLAAKAASLNMNADHLTAVEKTAAELAGYHWNFLTFAAAYMVGVICWLLIDATKPVVPEEPLQSGQSEC